MFMYRISLFVLVMGIVGGVALVMGCRTAARSVTAAGQDTLLAGFESGILKEWECSEGKMSVAEEHATEGRKSLRVDLNPGEYPGIGVDFGSVDWSGYRALRFSVFNPQSEAQPVTIRIDDAESTDYSTRYNLDGIRLAPGPNEVEIPIGSLCQGTLESQGLDVSRIKLMKIFTGGSQKPLTFFFDNFRLARCAAPGPDVLSLADFDKAPGNVEGTAGTLTRVVAAPDGQDGQALRIEFTPAAEYPGVVVSSPSDWLPYDLVCFDIICPENENTPGAMKLKITDSRGRGQTLLTQLKKGRNKVSFLLELANLVSLGQVKEFLLFWENSEAGKVVYLDNVRLERAGRLHYSPTRHNTAIETDPLTIDLSRVKAARNSCYRITAWIPLEGGGYRVAHCSCRDKHQTSYSIPADALKGYAAGAPLGAWAAYGDHGFWFWCDASISLKPSGQTQLIFDDFLKFSGSYHMRQADY